MSPLHSAESRRPRGLSCRLAAVPRHEYSDLEEPPEVAVAFETVVPWHLWGVGELEGFHRTNQGYDRFLASSRAFAALGHHEEIEDWQCDIRHIAGLASARSRGPLRHIATLDEMAELMASDLAAPISEAQLRKLLEAHRRGTSGHDCPAWHFFRHLWDERLFLYDHGDGRYFLAARYIAGQLGLPVPLRARLHVYGISPEAVCRLRRSYEMFVLSKQAMAREDFFDEMRRREATYLWHPMPEAYEDNYGVFLPRLEPRSMEAAAVLHEAGVFDLGLHLERLATMSGRLERQSCRPRPGTACGMYRAGR